MFWGAWWGPAVRNSFAADQTDASDVLSESELEFSARAEAETEFDASFVEQYPTLYRAAHKVAYRLLADREDVRTSRRKRASVPISAGRS